MAIRIGRREFVVALLGAAAWPFAALGRSIMTPSFSVRRHLLFAGALGTILVTTSWPLIAQQRSEPPPPWAQGRPAQEGAAMKLAEAYGLTV